MGYFYDAEGRRTARMVNGNGGDANAVGEWTSNGVGDAVTLYHYIGDDEVVERVRDNAWSDANAYTVTRRNYWGEGDNQLLGYAARANGGTPTYAGYFVGLDEQASVREVVDSYSAQRLFSIDYSDFGTPVFSAVPGGQSHPGFSYTGQWQDPATGLFDYSARWYDAGRGRFMSDDPLGFGAGDLNLQRYTGNNPITFTDPDGMLSSAYKDLTSPRSPIDGIDPLNTFGFTGQQLDISPVVGSFGDYMREEMYRIQANSVYYGHNEAAWDQLSWQAGRGGTTYGGTGLGWAGDFALAGLDETLMTAGHIALGVADFAMDPIGGTKAGYNHAVQQTSQFMAIGMMEGGSDERAFLDGAAYLVGSAIGARSVGEAAFGVDIVTAERLGAMDRWQRGLSGGGQLLLTGVGAGLSFKAATVAKAPAVLADDAAAIAARQATASPGPLLIEKYGVLSKNKAIPGQAHHLNQTAAYGDVIPINKGMSIKLEGNIFKDVGAPHTRAHIWMEDNFWAVYRGAELPPTNLQYTRALQQSLRAAGLPEAQVQQAVRAAIRERVNYGLLGGDEVPGIPFTIENLAR